MKHLKKFNFNKFGQDMPDCAIRSICAGIGIDYEAACKVLGVKCVEGKGYVDEYGIDLDMLQEKFSKFLGEVEENDNFESPIEALLNGQPLDDWLEESKKKSRFGTFLVYLDDNKMKDGGHIVCCKITSTNAYYIDTDDVGNMFVQCWIKVLKVIPKDSKWHFKYDEVNKKFI